MSPEFREAFAEKFAQDPSQYYIALGFIGFIAFLVFIMVCMWVSKRLILTYLYLKTGKAISGKNTVSEIVDEFKNH